MNSGTSSQTTHSNAVQAEIIASCRLPLMTLFVSAAVWLAISSIFGLIASIKFHSPNFLANCAWLTYGRIYPASQNALLYGFCIQAGLGVALWFFAWLGRIPLGQPLLISVGAKLWNLGVTIGFIAILVGDSAGYQNLEMPRYAALIVLLGYLLIALWAAVTFHQRRSATLFVSQWFFLAALFWFPWIYMTANLLVVVRPVRGVAQAIIAWWFSNNLQVVWLGLVGLGAILYFVPKLTKRELHSQYLAGMAFWLWMLFGSWGGIPNSAPVPAWVPAVSTAATVLTLIPLLAVALNIHRPIEGRCSELMATTTLRFIGFAVAAFILAGLMNIFSSLVQVSQITDLTWFTTAKLYLNNYGFFAMAIFGAAYWIFPQLLGAEFCPKLIRAHFWLAAIGVILIVLPLGIGGIVEGFKLHDANIPFIDVLKATLPFLRASTLGDLLILTGNVIFLINLGGLAWDFYRARAMSAYAVVTADMFKAGAQP